MGFKLMSSSNRLRVNHSMNTRIQNYNLIQKIFVIFASSCLQVFTTHWSGVRQGTSAFWIRATTRPVTRKMSSERLSCEQQIFQGVFHETCHHWQFVIHWLLPWQQSVTVLHSQSKSRMSLYLSVNVHVQIVSDDKFHEMPPWCCHIVCWEPEGCYCKTIDSLWIAFVKRIWSVCMHSCNSALLLKFRHDLWTAW